MMQNFKKFYPVILIILNFTWINITVFVLKKIYENPKEPTFKYTDSPKYVLHHTYNGKWTLKEIQVGSVVFKQPFNDRLFINTTKATRITQTDTIAYKITAYGKKQFYIYKFDPSSNQFIGRKLNINSQRLSIDFVLYKEIYTRD